MVQDICEGSSGNVVLIRVNISAPVEVEPGRFQTILSHPNLTGELVLYHGKERDLLLDALIVDPKEIDPVGTLFRHLVELRNPS